MGKILKQKSVVSGNNNIIGKKIAFLERFSEAKNDFFFVGTIGNWKLISKYLKQWNSEQSLGAPKDSQIVHTIFGQWKTSPEKYVWF